jgi:hypothetical protein
MARPDSGVRSGIVHFFQAISKTFGGGDHRFEGSSESSIPLERNILRGVSGREPSNLRSLRSSVESLFEIWLSKKDKASLIACDEHFYWMSPKLDPIGLGYFIFRA